MLFKSHFKRIKDSTKHLNVLFQSYKQLKLLNSSEKRIVIISSEAESTILIYYKEDQTENMIISPPVKKEFFTELVYFVISLLNDEISNDIPEWKNLLTTEIDKVKMQKNWTAKVKRRNKYFKPKCDEIKSDFEIWSTQKTDPTPTYSSDLMLFIDTTEKHLFEKFTSTDEETSQFSSTCSTKSSTTTTSVDENKCLSNEQTDICAAKFIDKRNYNPVEFDTSPRNARFFVIKSRSEEDIYQSIKYSVWCSTAHGNRRLDEAYAKQAAPVYLFFSVFNTRYFHGIAQMTSRVEFGRETGLWNEKNGRGCFQVRFNGFKIVKLNILKNFK